MHKLDPYIGDGAGARLSAAFIVLLFLGAAVSGLLPQDPLAITNDVLVEPSQAHWLGTDDLGRDVFANVVHGTRISLAVGMTASLAAAFLGIVLGGVAGYFGGYPDVALTRITEMLQVMPKFILAALVVAISGPGLSRVILVIAALSWPQAARIMRGEVLRIRQSEYVDAARCFRYSEMRILFGEVIPNAVGPTLAVATLVVAQAILLEAALSFFGLSDPGTPSWGRLLEGGQKHLSEAWWLSAFPGMAIFLTVLSFNVLGDAITRALSPKE